MQISDNKYSLSPTLFAPVMYSALLQNTQQQYLGLVKDMHDAAKWSQVSGSSLLLFRRLSVAWMTGWFCPIYISLICCWISGIRIKSLSSFQLLSTSVCAQFLHLIFRLLRGILPWKKSCCNCNCTPKYMALLYAHTCLQDALLRWKLIRTSFNYWSDLTGQRGLESWTDTEICA